MHVGCSTITNYAHTPTFRNLPQNAFDLAVRTCAVGLPERNFKGLYKNAATVAFTELLAVSYSPQLTSTRYQRHCSDKVKIGTGLDRFLANREQWPCSNAVSDSIKISTDYYYTVLICWASPGRGTSPEWRKLPVNSCKFVDYFK